VVRPHSGLLILKYFLSKGDFLIFAKLAFALQICLVPVSVVDVVCSRHPFVALCSLLSETLWCVFRRTELFYSILLVVHWYLVEIEPKRLILPCACHFKQS